MNSPMRSRKASPWKQPHAALGRTISRPRVSAGEPDGYLPGIGASPELMAEAFALTEQQPRSGRITSVGSKLTLIELRSRALPRDNELADEALVEKERILVEKRRLLLQAWLDTHRKRLDEAEQLEIDTSITTTGS